MKLEFLNDDGEPIATIVDAGPKVGIVCEGITDSSSAAAAGDFVNSFRPDLKAKLGRQPTSKELVEAIVAGGDKRIRKAE